MVGQVLVEVVGQVVAAQVRQIRLATRALQILAEAGVEWEQVAGGLEVQAALE